MSIGLKLIHSLQTQITDAIRRHSLPDEFIETVERWYLPVAQQIADLRAQKASTLLVSFNGSQGSGKSTLTAFLRLMLQHQFKLNTVELSIDDFYLSQQQRQRLASEVHPLFATRGVPGTHDVELAANTIQCLRHCADGSPCKLPRFNKATDNPLPQSEWPVVDEPVDIILFEGWCNHAPPQSEAQLQQPINELEAQEDSDARWRHYANDQLKAYHHRLFDQADLLVLLQAPSFEKVYEWRGLQEHKLRQSQQVDHSAVMDEAQLRRFIHHYERITRACLQHLPARADIVLQLDDDHAIQSITHANPDSADV